MRFFNSGGCWEPVPPFGTFFPESLIKDMILSIGDPGY